MSRIMKKGIVFLIDGISMLISLCLKGDNLNHVMKIGVISLVTGISISVYLFFRITTGSTSCFLFSVSAFALTVFFLNGTKLEKEEYDELEKTILLRTSNYTFVVLFYLGLLLYLSSLWTIHEEWVLKRIHLEIILLSITAVGSLIYAFALFIQYTYYQSERLLDRISILHVGYTALASFIVLSAAGIFYSLAATTDSTDSMKVQFGFYWLTIFPIGIIYNKIKKLPVAKFKLHEKVIYKRTLRIGLTVGLLLSATAMWIAFTGNTENADLFFTPILIGFWVGTFIHSVSSLVLFYFMDPEKKSLLVECSGKINNE